MRYAVIVSDQARQILGQHPRFLAQADRRAVEKRFLEEFCSLEQMPQGHPFFGTEFIPPYRYHKRFAENCFLVLYPVWNDTVYVDWIMDCRRDYPRLLKGPFRD